MSKQASSLGSKTIIYYTANREDPAFEQKIIEDMVSKAGDIPIISVSQKPMNLGYNICIGEVGRSYVNEWKQILIGAKQATTDYLLMAESDFLYPPEYFQFTPAGENIYRYDNIWIMWLDKSYRRNFHRKFYSEGAQIVKRKYFIDLLEDYFKGLSEWSDKHYKRLGLKGSPYLNQRYVFFNAENPCISIKTGRGVNNYTGYQYGAENVGYILPYWGHINDLRKRFAD